MYEVPCIFGCKTREAIMVSVPGSKSITNRALLLAAMADGESVLRGCLASDDSMYFIECLKKLGFPVKESEDKTEIRIIGFGGIIPEKKAEIYVGSAGTAARFLAAMLAFSGGEYIIKSSEQMKKRPMMPLISSLRYAGAEVECIEGEGHFPLRIRGVNDLKAVPETLSVNIDKSSQFLSALLIAAGTLKKPLNIRLLGNHGLSYVDMTVKMMEEFGVRVGKKEEKGEISYYFSEDNRYGAREYNIEPDVSAASYFYAAAAVTGCATGVNGVSFNMLQGDVKFLNVLEKMGCTLKMTENGLVLYNEKSILGGVDIDMSSFSDQALTLSAIAPFASSPVVIRGISHIKLQECDRINAIISNLLGLGIKAEERDDGIIIIPGQIHGGVIETYDDHRVAMAFAVMGLRAKGISIKNPECCRKTFKEFFTVLDNYVDMIRKY